MKPKKKDRTTTDEAKARFERLQADHEMFLQAFEKPTQIYRYLRSRNVVSPIVLQRNLSYMCHRSKRKKATRTGFSVDSILDKVQAKYMKQNPKHSYKSEFMNLAFIGFYDQGEQPITHVEVEVFLMKFSHKKRKDVSSPMTRESVGKVQVSVNPDPQETPSKHEGVSVGSNLFMHNNGHMVKSYALSFVITVTAKTSLPNGGMVNGLSNGDVNNGEEEHDEPSPKRRRSSTNHHHHNNEFPAGSPPQTSPADGQYGSDLVVYDRNQRCLLTDGEYELVLQDLQARQPPKKQATWETVMDGRAVGPFEIFNNCPTLKFKLNWNQQPLEVENLLKNDCDDINDGIIVPNHLVPSSEFTERTDKASVLSPSKRKRIFYQFLYNNNTRQQTEARDDLHCPWCSLSCLQVFSLLKHLRSFHARFNFTYSEHPKGARIDVSINQCYDGAYVGNPQDLHSHIGYAFSRNGPVRRTPVTHVLLYRAQKPTFDLAEFMEPESEVHSTRQTVQGHNRLYYHTITCQPVRACEIDIDLENKNDPLWLRQKTQQMIDEFTDVNEGEKEVMKMWNLHVMRHNILGDCQMSRTCLTFVQEYGISILQKNLLRNFVLHLVNLYDFGLLRPEQIYRVLMTLFQLRNRLEALGHLTYSSPAHYELDAELCKRLQQELDATRPEPIAQVTATVSSSNSSTSQPEDMS